MIVAFKPYHTPSSVVEDYLRQWDCIVVKIVVVQLSTDDTKSQSRACTAWPAAHTKQAKYCGGLWKSSESVPRGRTYTELRMINVMTMRRICCCNSRPPDETESVSRELFTLATLPVSNEMKASVCVATH